MNILIIGGGISGISTAKVALKEQHNVTVLDCAPEPGGLMARIANCRIGFKTFFDEIKEKKNLKVITGTNIVTVDKIGGKYINEIEHWNVEGMDTPILKEAHHPNEYGFYQGSSANHDKFYKNVLDALKGQVNKITVGSDGKKAVEIILAAKKSAELGIPIDLPLK